MPLPPHLRDLVEHAEWADAALWSCVLATPEAARDPRCLEWLHHVHRVQRSFLTVWREEELETRDLEDFEDARAVAHWGREGHREIRSFLEALDEGRLAEVVEIPWARRVAASLGRPAGLVTLEQSIVQVAMHSAHHRGQVAARLRRLDGEPPLVDYIAWLWFGRPAPDSQGIAGT
jgi:uncharacterized damage-inducible protein DinB